MAAVQRCCRQPGPGARARRGTSHALRGATVGKGKLNGVYIDHQTDCYRVRGCSN